MPCVCRRLVRVSGNKLSDSAMDKARSAARALPLVVPSGAPMMVAICGWEYPPKYASSMTWRWAGGNSAIALASRRSSSRWSTSSRTLIPLAAVTLIAAQSFGRAASDRSRSMARLRTIAQIHAWGDPRFGSYRAAHFQADRNASCTTSSAVAWLPTMRNATARATTRYSSYRRLT